MMSIARNLPAILACIGLTVHLVVGAVALRGHFGVRVESKPFDAAASKGFNSTLTRRPAAPPRHSLLPLLNLATALCVLAYWARVWYGYVTRGVTWYASDQLVPLYAIAVVILSGVALAGWYDGRLAHWLVFVLDTTALLGATLYLTFARFNRLF